MFKLRERLKHVLCVLLKAGRNPGAAVRVGGCFMHRPQGSVFFPASSARGLFCALKDPKVRPGTHQREAWRTNFNLYSLF
jgi:hypothetical protein